VNKNYFGFFGVFCKQLILLGRYFTLRNYILFEKNESTIIMERIHTLIDKLSQQKAQGASPAHLLFTVQLLQQELLQLQKAEDKAWHPKGCCYPAVQYNNYIICRNHFCAIRSGINSGGNTGNGKRDFCT
jgi:hypothetical protein